MAETYVILGAGHAGGRAAETLREEGFAGRIVLVGREEYRPYMRPMLTKEYLRGDQPIDDAFLKPDGWYAENGIELKTGTEVTKLSPRATEVTLATGERIRYDKLLVTTGAQPRRLGVPGEDLPGVYHLRTIADSEALKPELKKKRHIVVIGTGWIGLEVAASARTKGCDVTVIGHGSVPLEKALGTEVGKVMKKIHDNHGVRFTRAALKGFTGRGTLEGVKMASKTIACDAVVVAVGVEPDTAVLEQAGLTINDGLVTNEYFESETPNIYAAGDVARVHHPFYDQAIRIEHWANAQNQGPAAARNMLGQQRPYELLPYFFSDQYDVGIEYIGRHHPDDQVVYRGDVAAHTFAAFYLNGSRVTAGLVMNTDVKTDMIEALIKTDRPVDPKELADPTRPLATLL
jgi:3-phenylpropionate/trans-cinnamate dioxygenase ferredoxin reductase subunit